MSDEKTVTAYKGFNKDFACHPDKSAKPFQYEVGKTYEHAGPIVRCANGGFHSCENPWDVLNYYPLGEGRRYARVTASGAIDKGDDKMASARITIEAEIGFPGLLAAGAAWLIDLGKKVHAETMKIGADKNTKATTGNRSAAATTGDSSAAATTGNSSAAATTGDSSAAATTGYRSAAATTGDSSAASVKGQNSIAAALGSNSTASAEKGGAIMLAAYDVNGKLRAVFASKVGENDIEAGKVYRLQCNGVPVEVK